LRIRRHIQKGLDRVETKIFVFIFSRTFRENLFLLFAKKAYKKVQKFAHFRFSQKLENPF
jgi:hypothetical protein